ncbi:MAG: hypothetical protein DHS20C21_21270 [Gemmatimonadota bacterium]|nr:MAG: hypothetical protein DHS20C21_21270 [Gemmatimonadota bacterium]
MNENGSLQENRELFDKFGEYFAAGLAPRIEGEIAAGTLEIEPSNREDVAARIADGALLGRTIWGEEGAERTGCFLWIGGLGVLVGESNKTVADLTDDEVSTLDHSLKLNIEEGADDNPTVDWSDVERIGPEELAGKLNEIGVEEEFEVAALPISVAEQKMTFLFLMSTGAAGADVADAGSAAADPEEAAIPTGEVADAEEADVAAGITSHVGEAAAAEAPSAVGDDDDAPAEPPSSGDEADLTAAEIAASAALALGDDARGGIPGSQMKNLEYLLDVKLPLTIRLGATRIQLDELLKLTPGAILELDRREEEPLEVLANGQVVARGEVVVVDERFGLRITEIGSSEERVRATL